MIARIGNGTKALFCRVASVKMCNSRGSDSFNSQYSNRKDEWLEFSYNFIVVVLSLRRHRLPSSCLDFTILVMQMNDIMLIPHNERKCAMAESYDRNDERWSFGLTVQLRNALDSCCVRRSVSDCSAFVNSTRVTSWSGNNEDVGHRSCSERNAAPWRQSTVGSLKDEKLNNGAKFWLGWHFRSVLVGLAKGDRFLSVEGRHEFGKFGRHGVDRNRREGGARGAAVDGGRGLVRTAERRSDGQSPPLNAKSGIVGLRQNLARISGCSPPRLGTVSFLSKWRTVRRELYDRLGEAVTERVTNGYPQMSLPAIPSWRK